MRRPVHGLALLAVLLAAACGGSSRGSSGAPAGQGGTLTVFAAASLTEAFTDLKSVFEREHPGWSVALDFAGSDELAAQIEQGARADVYAAASPKYPDLLKEKKLLGSTTDFATNTLVLVVPPSNPAGIRSVEDLRKGAKLVVGDDAVPVGAYTQTVLENLHMPESSLHVVSKEQDVKSVLAKVELGEADAGFVYVTDARSARDKVERISLPTSAQATAVYPIGVLSQSDHEDAAEQWIQLVTSPSGQKVLTGLAFGPAPSV